MDILVTVGAIAAIVGIVAGIVQVLDYLQKRRESRAETQRELEAKPADHASPEPYSIAAIRNLLRDAFTADEFQRFCRDRPLFEPLLSRFGPDASLEDMIEVALEYCRKRSLLPDLLAEVEAFNPRQWERHHSRIHRHEEQVQSKIPENLDPRGEFVGRKAEKAEVHEALRRSRLVCIEGIGGIGKTALALEVAHECLQASKDPSKPADVATFDGFAWVSARDRDVNLDDVLDAVARTLDYTGIVQKPEEEKQVAVRGLLRAKRYLLIVDNYETISDENVRQFLLGLPEPSKALITSRERAWTEAEIISLKDLSQSESFKLMRRMGQRLRLKAIEQASDEELLPLHQTTGGVPLAIRWAIGQIRQKGQSLDEVLGALAGVTPDVFDNIFARSWALLSTDAQQVLTVMPIFVAPASEASVAAASGVEGSALAEALGQLVEISLADASDELRPRYSIHPLTRAFAQVKLQSRPAFRSAALQRLAHYYRSFAEQNGGFWSQKGFAQLELEMSNLLANIQECLEGELAAASLSTLFNVNDFLVIRGYWNDALALGREAITVASDRGDEFHAALFHTWPVGWIYRHRRDLQSAEYHVAQALITFEKLGKEEYIAHAKRNLGRIYFERGDFAQAKHLFEESLAYFKSIGDERHIYFVTANLAGLLLEQGDLAAAKELCDEVLESARRFDVPEILGHLLEVLGAVEKQEGDLIRAKEYWYEVLTQMQRANRPDEIADAQFEIAQIEMRTGHQEAARKMLASALEAYQRLAIQPKIRATEDLLAHLATSELQKGQAHEN